WPGTWCAGAPCSEIVTPSRVFATPTAGILNMSGFLLRLIRHTRSRRGAATPGRDRYWLANNARERHLLSPPGGGVTKNHWPLSSGVGPHPALQGGINARGQSVEH